MRWFRFGARAASGILLGLLALPAAQTTAQAPAAADAARPHKSVYGQLERVDESLNALVMRSDDGQRLAWRLDKRVIAEAARFKPGAPLIVIYRQLSAAEKRVTAVAFPGTASAPTYTNLTGSRVLLRSAPASGDTCQPDAGPVTDQVVPAGRRTEIAEGCWCCVSTDETCVPQNRTGLGEALLVYCFK